jgi:hypothetical protein
VSEEAVALHITRYDADFTEDDLDDALATSP